MKIKLLYDNNINLYVIKFSSAPLYIAILVGYETPGLSSSNIGLKTDWII